jgi:hypothetical protein
VDAEDAQASGARARMIRRRRGLSLDVAAGKTWPMSPGALAAPVLVVAAAGLGTLNPPHSPSRCCAPAAWAVSG